MPLARDESVLADGMTGSHQHDVLVDPRMYEGKVIPERSAKY